MTRLLTLLLFLLLTTTVECAAKRAPVKVQPVKAPLTANSTDVRFDPNCRCNPTTVWNDVMFLFDISEATGKKHLEDMLATFKTLAYSYTIKRKDATEEKVMRAGVISYASTVDLVAPLGAWEADDIYTWNPQIKQGDLRTDLKSAIQLASAQLGGAAHRKSSKPVIVVFATTFNEYGEQSPLTVAQDFISNGGAIITYEYISNDGGDDSMLRKIASEGFALNSKQHEFQDVLKSQCDVNCFCPNNYHAYEFGDKHTPIGGCYWPVSAPAMSRLATTRCKQFNNGFIIKVESEQKDRYLRNLTRDIGSHYIGAEWNLATQRWEWADGTEVSDYTNWCAGEVPSGGGGHQCAYVAKDELCWQGVPCNWGLQYVCQSSPCDSTRYCQLE